jgi:hypothetical protein
MLQVTLDIPNRTDWDALLPLFRRLQIRYQVQEKAMPETPPSLSFDLDEWLQRNQNSTWDADDIKAWENDIQKNMRNWTPETW